MGPELRPNQIFDTDEWPLAATRDRKPFKFYLRKTPATPLSAGTKAVLWAAGAVVAALLLVVLMRAGRSSPPRSAARSAAAVRPLAEPPARPVAVRGAC